MEGKGDESGFKKWRGREMNPDSRLSNPEKWRGGLMGLVFKGVHDPGGNCWVMPLIFYVFPVFLILYFLNLFICYVYGRDDSNFVLDE